MLASGLAPVGAQSTWMLAAWFVEYRLSPGWFGGQKVEAMLDRNAWPAGSHCDSAVQPAGQVPRLPPGIGGRVAADAPNPVRPLVCCVSWCETKKKNLSRLIGPPITPPY